MVRASLSHLDKILRHALRIENARHSHIRTMCGQVWASDLKKLSVEVLCKKWHFLRLHCDISNIYYMYSIGIFHNRDVLSIIVSAIKQRNDHTDV